VFCVEIKWTDAPVLIYDRKHFRQQRILTISLISSLWWRLLARASTHSACWVI